MANVYAKVYANQPGGAHRKGTCVAFDSKGPFNTVFHCTDADTFIDFYVFDHCTNRQREWSLLLRPLQSMLHLADFHGNADAGKLGWNFANGKKHSMFVVTREKINKYSDVICIYI